MASQSHADVHSSWGAILFGPAWQSAWLLCLGVGLHAINWFMVVTVMPMAATELEAVPLISWATTVFLVFSIIGGASGGRLKIQCGARLVLAVSTLFFLAGTVIAAFAPSMEVLLIGRALQGAPEGVILAVSYALVRELFAPEAIPRAFGLLAVVYAVGATFGPLAAGLLTEHFGWRIAFMINLPLAACYLWLLATGLRRHGDRTREGGGAVAGLRLSLIGLATFIICLAGLAETAAMIMLDLSAAFACFVLAVAIDRRSEQPLFPTGAFTLSSPVAFGLWVALLLPAASAGVHVYTPFMVHTIGGGSAVIAGYFGALTAIGWSTSAILVARVPPHRSDIALIAGPCLVTTTTLATGWLLSIQASLVPLAGCLLLIGMGFGICWAFLAQRTQAVARPAERDLAAGATPTLLSAGGAVGAAIAGLLANFGGLRGQAGTDPMTAEVVANAAWWVFAGGAAIAATAGLASAVFVGVSRDLPSSRPEKMAE